ncbi:MULTISPECIES: TM2 domain-containing protein [Mammaliicoccus]|uniref:TM2 domain-containing protein n=1 Tax=Mammaliicoccus fleurettii TaxID=150056 RepID=A0ABS5MPW8_9STAP|nr:MULTISPECIES: TM2 domain-containing protein [Mammaliicoccus]HCN59637.1 TM2 domain-containing protein [Staphylococcus sp.]MBL0848103.1 TM2 domain-containing protein [Mammaliicoccus fleurettii]MBO3062661.1 TM2 domain-containing protein [Mammaliicoccus fleurettii]MBS3672815.1 TM2 domain-containing protein [Mammaliicoccus fleurettii]MBS3697973.1 TM2 domain-containing protein [Mammaliicoccus fleurettii]
MLVNKWIYIALALLLGNFGVHKFYAQKPISGLLHLVFCWTGIPQVIAIISAVLALLKPADEQGNIQV